MVLQNIPLSIKCYRRMRFKKKKKEKKRYFPWGKIIFVLMKKVQKRNNMLEEYFAKRGN